MITTANLWNRAISEGDYSLQMWLTQLLEDLLYIPIQARY